MSKPKSNLSIPGRHNNSAGDDNYNSEPADDEDDENDPFADRNAVVTPRLERSEPSW